MNDRKRRPHRKCAMGVLCLLLIVSLLAGCGAPASTQAQPPASDPTAPVETQVPKTAPPSETAPPTEMATPPEMEPPTEGVEDILPALPPENEETITSILDRDGTDGYTGDFVLVYHPQLSEAGNLSLGNVDGLLRTDAPAIPVSGAAAYLATSPGLSTQADPYVTDQLRQADDHYSLASGDLWQVGFQKVFDHIGVAGMSEMLFTVSSVTERCRVWSPVNPDFGALESKDEDAPALLAQAVEEAIPMLEEVFGPIPDIRGDGKINVLCYDFNSPITLGVTSFASIYDTVTLRTGETFAGNSLPMAEVNTAPLLQDKPGAMEDIISATIHEIQHTISFGLTYPGSVMDVNLGKVMLSELLSAAAQELADPGSTYRHIPYWYHAETTWEDLAEDDAWAYLRDGDNPRQSGFFLFDWSGYREDYSVMSLLAHFAENRGGREVFTRLISRWEEIKGVPSAVEALYDVLGYADYAPFMEDFLLSILLHEEDGPYQLIPFAGGEENPFSAMVPVITDKGIYVRPGGCAVLCPVDGVYYPPANTGEGLRYVGITMKP